VTTLLPDVADPLTQRFWEGLRAGVIVMQRCPACGYVRWPPAAHCPECLLVSDDWRELAPTGELWSYVVYHRALHGAFSAQVPYVVGRVVLDDGPVLTARVDAPRELVTVGARARPRRRDR